jgi:hypothetical protein
MRSQQSGRPQRWPWGCGERDCMDRGIREDRKGMASREYVEVEGLKIIYPLDNFELLTC